MSRPSLKWRVSLLVTAVLAGAIAGISTVAYVELRSSFLRNIDRTLLAMAKAIEAELDEGAAGDLLDREVRFITGSSPHRRSVRYRIWREGQAEDLLASEEPTSKYGRWLRELPASPRPSPGKNVFLDLGEHGDEYRAIWARPPAAGGEANILVAHSSHYEYHEMQEVLNILLILGGAMMVVSATVATALVVLALRPVGQTAGRLRQVTYRNLGAEHLADLDVPAELRPFLAAVKELLGRLDRAARRQKQFTADASHELRTPLSLAKSTLQLARCQPRSCQEYERAVDEALSDIDRIERLIDQLLVLARMDEANGNGAGPAADVRLDKLLAAQAAAFEPRAAGAGGRILCEPMPETHIRGSEALLGRLVANLLDNAVKYGRPGGTVRVSLQHQEDGTCIFSIHDEGGGIPPEAIPHLFDRFYRVDSARNGQTGGAGLGLAIAREIARGHGGDIEIRSAPETGTVVTVRLPMCRPCATGA